jgi:hypothetical protein
LDYYVLNNSWNDKCFRQKQIKSKHTFCVQ